MLGTIIGDVVGSIYERHNIKTKDFPLFGPNCRFTVDTVTTVSVADAILRCSERRIAVDADALIDSLKEWGHRYPHAGYGGGFRCRLRDDSRAAYNSWGNGSAMRVSACAWVFQNDAAAAEALAALTASVTHNHPEGIKGAVETTRAEWLMLRARRAVAYPDSVEEAKRQLGGRADTR